MIGSPKDHIFKTLGSYAKSYVQFVKKMIKVDTQIVKNENFPQTNE